MGFVAETKVIQNLIIAISLEASEMTRQMTSRARGKNWRSERTKGSGERTKDDSPDAPGQRMAGASGVS